MQREKTARKNIVRLADLAPRRDVKGGSARVVFGAEAPAGSGQTTEEAAMAGKKKGKDLAPKKPVKGGGKAGW